MKARIVNNKFNSIYTDEYLTNISEEWDLTEILPTEEELEYISLMFDFATNKYYEGATAEEIAEANKLIVPSIITARQLRLQLVLNGFNLNTIDLIIDSLPEPNKSIAKVSWEYATTFEREHQMLGLIAQQIGITETELDTIFINAEKL